MPISVDVRDATAHAEPESAESVLDECFDELKRADDTFSLWREDTPMAAVSARALALADAPPEVLEVLRDCAEWGRRTGGAFTARRPDGRVDPTGLVKAWAVQRVGDRLQAAGLKHWCVNAAGDVLVHGQARPGEGWTVGISNPLHPGALVDTVTLTRGAVATSGTSERGEHIWRPATGKSARGWASVTVVADDLVTADVLATAAIAAEPEPVEWLERIDGVRALAVSDSGTVIESVGWRRVSGVRAGVGR